MPIRYVTGSTIVTADGADALTANDGETILVAQGATLGATGVSIGGGNPSAGIYGSGTFSFVSVAVQGLVFGDHGVNLTGASTLSASVGAAGQVFGAAGVGVYLSAGTVSLLNEGLVQSSTGLAVNLTGNAAQLVNSGTINLATGSGYTIQLDVTGTSSVVNTGMISGGPFGYSLVSFGTSNDTIWNAGQMNGSMLLGAGNDLYQGPGRIEGTIDAGQGNDTIIGGADSDTIYDVFGTNWLAGGGGSDRIRIAVLPFVLSPSHLFGGEMGGPDTSTQDWLWVDEFGAGGANVFLGGGFVSRVSDGAVIAFMTGIENARGTFVADALIGSDGANVLEGAGGADWLVGNGGADRFVFSLVNHAQGDQVRDLRRSQGDRIDLGAIDADTASAGDDAFAFRTSHTNNAAGEAVITNYGTSARVDLYVNADNLIDGFFFVVYGEAGMTNLQAADFLL